DMIGKIVEVQIDEAKQYSLNGTFIRESGKAVVTP
ncbi:TRAM domain-containing protein, partial [Staphylococcus epidermidis]